MESARQSVITSFSALPSSCYERGRNGSGRARTPRLSVARGAWRVTHVRSDAGRRPARFQELLWLQCVQHARVTWSKPLLVAADSPPTPCPLHRPSLMTRWGPAVLGTAATAVLCARSAVSASLNPVRVDVEAPWADPPLGAELLEAWAYVSSGLAQPASAAGVAAAASTGAISSPEAPAADLFDVLDGIHAIGGTETADAVDADQLAIFESALNALDVPASQHAWWKTAVAARSTTPRFAAQWATIAQPPAPAGCSSWIHLPRSGMDLCDPNVLPSAIDRERALPKASFTRFTEVDHTFAADSAAPGATAIFYADGQTLLSPRDLELHTILRAAARDGQIEYILRWALPPESSGAVKLSGYGASLDLKKVDYLVVDDRVIESDAPLTPDQQALLAPTGDDPTQSDGHWLRSQFAHLAGPGDSAPDALTPLSQKVSWLISASSNPVRALRTLVSDLPNHVSWIQSLNLFEGPKQEQYKAFDAALSGNQQRILPAGTNLLWLNGASVPLTESDSAGTPPAHQDVQSLLRTLSDEERRMSRVLQSANSSLSVAEAKGHVVQLLNDDRVLGLGKTSLLRFDASDAREGDEGAVVRVTDVRRAPNEEQQDWGRALAPLLVDSVAARTNPALVQRNLFEVIWALDLRAKGNLVFLAEALPYITTSVPMTWGIVPLLPAAGSDAAVSEELARILHFVSRSAGPRGVLQWIEAVALDSPRNQDKQHIISVSAARRAAHLVLDRPLSRQIVVDQLNVLHHAARGEKDDQQHDLLGTAAIAASRNWAKRLGVPLPNDTVPPPRPIPVWPGMRPPPPPPSGIAFINGERVAVDERWISKLSASLGRDLEALTEALRSGELQDEIMEDTDSVEGFFYRRPETLSHFSPLVDRLVAQRPLEIVATAHAPVIWSSPDANVSLILVADLDRPESQSVLRAALAAAQEAPYELRAVHQPGTKSLGAVSSGLFSLLSNFGRPADLREQVDAILDSPGSAALPDSQRWWEDHAVSLEPLGGQVALVLNGKPLLADAHEVSTSDLLAIIKLEGAQRASALRESIAPLVGAVSAGQLAQVRYAVYEARRDPFYSTGVAPRLREALSNIITEHGSAISVGSRGSPLSLVLALDPTSDEAPQFAASLALLERFPNVHVKVVFNPPRPGEDDELDPRRVMAGMKQKDPEPPELPALAKRFTRHLVPELNFDAHGRRVMHPLFFGGNSLPQDEVLTLTLVAPPAWHTMPAKALYDLDNLRLAALPEGQDAGVEVTYSLEGLLVQGHAVDLSSRQRDPPSGMQLLLQRPRVPSALVSAHAHTSDSESHDTIVMANLAYFQFRAQPGQWSLHLRPGRTAEVYKLAQGQEFAISLASLEGITVQPKFVKRAGMANVRLVEDPEAPTTTTVIDEDGYVQMVPTGSGASVWSKLGSKVKSLLPKSTSRHADINIFTIASGHLYERFMSIMILRYAVPPAREDLDRLTS